VRKRRRRQERERERGIGSICERKREIHYIYREIKKDRGRKREIQ
jgi:hypothetical protein